MATVTVTGITKPKSPSPDQIKFDIYDSDYGAGRLKLSSKYGPMDADTGLFLHHFKESKNAKILEVGCNEECAADILTDNGWTNIVGVDLQPPHRRPAECNFKRVEGDFCKISDNFRNFDCVFSLSAIEHFGLSAYGEDYQPFLDIIAMDRIWSVLKPGGTCYLTVPYGKDHITELAQWPQWRSYSKKSLYFRLIQRFKVEIILCFTACDTTIDGVRRGSHQPVSLDEADRYPGRPPHVMVFLKMRKECQLASPTV